MSKTLAALRADIRERLNDTNPGDYVFPSSRLDRMVETHLQAIGQTLFGNLDWAVGAVTLVVGTTDYALPALEYDLYTVIKLHSTGQPLKKMTPEDIYQIRANLSSSSGNPRSYALLENSLGVKTLLLDYAPLEADTLDILRSVQESDLTPADADVIDFPRAVLRGLELFVCAEAIGSATDDQLEKLKMRPDVARLWNALAQKMVEDERDRQALMRVATDLKGGYSDVWQS